MEISTILSAVWTAMNSPMGITVAASIALWILNKIYATQPLWQKYEGVIISAIKFAEKNIPDSHPNKSLARLDEALIYVLIVYEKAEGKRADNKVMSELKNGIGIIHAELESSGSLEHRVAADIDKDILEDNSDV